MLTKIHFLKLPEPLIQGKLQVTHMHKQEETFLSPPIAMTTFRFPTFLYGPSITSSTGTTAIKSSEALEESQVVSADPKFVLQVWN